MYRQIPHYFTVTHRILSDPDLINSLASDPDVIDSILANPEVLDALKSDPELTSSLASNPNVIQVKVDILNSNLWMSQAKQYMPPV